MAQDIHVKGLKELNLFLQDLPVKMEKNIMRGALRAGMNVVKPVAQGNIHEVSGALAKSLRVGTRAKGGRVIGYLKAGEWYGRLVEFGTKAHFVSVRMDARPSRRIRAGRPGDRMQAFSIGTINKMVARGSLKIGTHFVGASVAHPGARRRPFMRPALDAMASAAVNAAAHYIRERLETKHGLDVSGVLLEGDE